MENIRNFINTFVNEDYFIIILAILIMILIVLVMALLKTRKQYQAACVNERLDDDDLLSSLKSNDILEELPPIDRNMNISFNIDDYEDEISHFEGDEEESAVISTEELAQKAEERRNELGVTDNQAMIQKYEDEQEKKAIISYEQLLQNASNITITYKEEKTVEGAPKVNKIEVQEKDVSEPQCYIEEEKFLSILKDFRTSLPR